MRLKNLRLFFFVVPVARKYILRKYISVSEYHQLMGKTTFQQIWDEYLELDLRQRGSFLYHASETLLEQGHHEAHRAVLYQAVEDAREAGDVRLVADASIELSKSLTSNREQKEARSIIEASIEAMPGWCSFELGLCLRELATLAEQCGEKDEQERNLRAAASYFRADGRVDFSFPLDNKICHIFLERENWTGLGELLKANEIENDANIAPAAIAIRKYIKGRYLEHNLEFEQATDLLWSCSQDFRTTNHELYKPAIDALGFAMRRSGMHPLKYIEERPSLALDVDAEFLQELIDSARVSGTLF